MLDIKSLGHTNKVPDSW